MKISKVNDDIQQSSYLWRYFSLQKLISFLHDKSIVFSRLDKLEDKNEAISMNQLLLAYGSKTEKQEVAIAGQRRIRKEKDLTDRQKNYYVSCWVEHHRESMAMWNSYSSDEGVALKVRFLDLINRLTTNSDTVFDKTVCHDYAMYYGRVSYRDFLSKNERLKFKEEIKIIGFHKDICFQHEKEYRFLLKLDYPAGDQKSFDNEKNKIIKAKLQDFSNFNIELIFQPKMEDWKRENVRKLIEILGLSNITTKDSEINLRGW